MEKMVKPHLSIRKSHFNNLPNSNPSIKFEIEEYQIFIKHPLYNFYVRVIHNNVYAYLHADVLRGKPYAANLLTQRIVFLLFIMLYYVLWSLFC